MEGLRGSESNQLIVRIASQSETLRASRSAGLSQHAISNQGSREKAGGTQSQPQQINNPANVRGKRNGAGMSEEQRLKKRMSDKNFKDKLKEKQEEIKRQRDELATENVHLRKKNDEKMKKRVNKLKLENDQLKLKLEALEPQLLEATKEKYEALLAKEKLEALLAKERSDAEKKDLDFKIKSLQRDLENALQRENYQLCHSTEQQHLGNSIRDQANSSQSCRANQVPIFLPRKLKSAPERMSTSKQIRSLTSSALHGGTLPNVGNRKQRIYRNNICKETKRVICIMCREGSSLAVSSILTSLLVRLFENLYSDVGKPAYDVWW